MNKVNEIVMNIDPTNHKFDYSVLKGWAAQSASAKGKTGEKVAASILEDKGYKVTERVTKEHDLIVDTKKVEVKTAFEKRDSDYFSMYGLDTTEDWHWLLFQMVTPEKIYGFKLDRKALADIYLDKSRKNTMCNVTMKNIKESAELIYEYGV